MRILECLARAYERKPHSFFEKDASLSRRTAALYAASHTRRRILMDGAVRNAPSMLPVFRSLSLSFSPPRSVFLSLSLSSAKPLVFFPVIIRASSDTR